ncbi:MAG: hypothetical protein ACM3UO_00165 [Bacillota bacterium]
MQPLNEGIRGGLTKEQVRRLLQSTDDLEITYGADGLNRDLQFKADLTPYMSTGSSITSDTTAVIHRTCQFVIDSSCIDVWNYHSGFVRPWQRFTNPITGDSAQFNLGVFTLPTAPNDLSTLPSILTFTGYDLNYFLQQEIGESYEVPRGVDPVAAAAQAIALACPGAFVDWTPSNQTTPTTLTWPFNGSTSNTTWLQVITTLLHSVGYRAAWVDWNGTFRLEPYRDAQTVPAEWTFDLTSPINIIGEQRQQTQDLFSVPNWWRFVMANQTSTPVEGTSQYTYTDDSAQNPGSTRNRGRLVKYTESVNVTNFAALKAYALKKVTADLKPSETIVGTIQPFPLLWHFDVVEYNDPNLSNVTLNGATNRRMVVTKWTLPLDGQTDEQITMQTVTDQFIDIETAPAV